MNNTMELQFTVMPVAPLDANCTIAIEKTSGRGMIFDPGGNVDQILENFDKLGGTKLEAVYCTHGHADHILGVPELLEKMPARLYVPRLDLPLWKAVYDQCRMFSIAVDERTMPDPDVLLDEGDRTVMGDAKVLHAPGHSPGSVCFYFEEAGILIGGDVLFRHSIGRTDLPGGNSDQLLQSIREKLFVLPPEVTVIAGHGPATTIADEIENNPFL